MSETPQSRLETVRQEVEHLRRSMGEFSRAVEVQRRSLRQLHAAIRNSPYQQVAQEAINSSVTVANTAQQIASRLPLTPLF